MGLKIDILATNGSVLGVTTASIYGDDGRMGVGGAELAMLTMCEEWAKAGHKVTLYNNPTRENTVFEQKPIDSFEKFVRRDILIVFRAPTGLVDDANGKHIWWSTDQYTVGSYKDFAKHVDKIVCISPFHQNYFRDIYGIENTISIDLPVRIEDYVGGFPKIPHRFLFSSVPDRGLHQTFDMWPAIQSQIPDATLVITSDYRLWGCASPLNEQFAIRSVNMPGVTFLGAIPRRSLVREQLMADMLLYPCIYEELFCYAVAEAQVAGTPPVTPPIGALSTTNMHKLTAGSPDAMIGGLLEFLNSPDKEKIRQELMDKARKRFSAEVILKEWNEKVFA
jgi:glycosyltransferase involved in cell wall biosynthesis